MKIALLSPAGAMHRYNGLFSKNLHYAPMTLTLLAALVPKELNAEIVIYDETAEAIPLDLQADVIGITCITGTSTRAYRYADFYRSLGITVVLGGPHPSLSPEEAAQHADAVVVGVADESWPELLRDFQSGNLKKTYVARDDVCIANRPPLRRDLLKKKKYITLNTVEAIRGCHLNCSFCAYPKAFGRRVIPRPVEEIVAEIKTLKGREVIFPDVNLLSDEAFSKDLFTAMIPLKKWWFGLTTSDVAFDAEMLDLFERSGCVGLLIGFESVNQNSQAQMRKGFNKVRDYKELMARLHARGIMVMGCFAFGSDEDREDVFARTVQMADEIKIDLPRYAIFTPFPKTDYFTGLEAENRIVEHDFALYDVEHCVFSPKHMTKETLEAGTSKAWRDSYTFRSIWKRWEWRNLKILRVGFVYWLTNLGYRKYAKKFEIFNSSVTSDNSDIPLPQ